MCGNAGHNARSCILNKEISDKEDRDEVWLTLGLVVVLLHYLYPETLLVSPLICRDCSLCTYVMLNK